MVVDSRGGRKTLIILHSTLLGGTPGTRRRGFVAKALVRRPVDESAHWSVDESLFFGCVCVLFFFLFFSRFPFLQCCSALVIS